MDSAYTGGRSSNSSSVPLSRGVTSPWSILLGGTASANVPSFHNSTSQLSDEETSLFLSSGVIRYDLTRGAPDIGRDQVYVYVRNYATIAPYPILDWGPLVGVLNALLEYGTASTSGQVACIWIVSDQPYHQHQLGHSCANCLLLKQYMAFGCTQYSVGIRSDTEAGDSGVYFHKAWTMLPQLLMENDLWALKAVTLMVSPTLMSTFLRGIAWHRMFSNHGKTLVSDQLKYIPGPLSPGKCQTGSLLVSTRDSFTIVNFVGFPCRRVKLRSIL